MKEAVKLIPLSQGQYRGIKNREPKFVIVDEENYDFLIQWKWYCSNTGYATRDVVVNRKNPRIVKKIGMHRVLVNAIDGEMVDHINMIRLDNRKSNLRKCSYAENAWNRKKPKPRTSESSKYKGVSFEKKGSYERYKAEIRVNQKRISLGSFTNERDAALAYNEAAKKYHGEFARLNPI